MGAAGRRLHLASVLASRTLPGDALSDMLTSVTPPRLKFGEMSWSQGLIVLLRKSLGRRLKEGQARSETLSIVRKENISCQVILHSALSTLI